MVAMVYPVSQLLWMPDVIIHDLVMFSKPEILNEVAALEIFQDGKVYYKIRFGEWMVIGGRWTSGYAGVTSL